MLFCFFKQKTSYEMRISDWSSDVCSSDLIGDKEKDDGVVFLIAPNERRMSIAVGYGLEPILTDALSGRIIRDVVTPKFKAGDMPGGIQDGVGAIAEQIQLTPEEAAARAAARSEEHTSELQALMRISYAVFCLKKN